MDKKFIKVPLVLALICVGSAGLISGVHALTQMYIDSRPVNVDAPAAMKALYPGKTFEPLPGFCSYKRKDAGMTAKVTLASGFAVKDGSSEIAYCYDLQASSISGAVNSYASFEAPVDSSTTAEQINPAKVFLYEHAYSNSKGPNALISALEGGDDLDETLVLGTGSTESEKTLKSELLAARNDYVERKKGGRPGDCGTPAPELPTDAKGWLEYHYPGKTVEKVDGFTPYHERTSAGYIIDIFEKFIVKDGSTEVAVGYHTGGEIPDEDGEDMDLAVSFEGTCADDENAKKAFKPAYVMAISGHQDYADIDKIREYADAINAGTVDATTNPNSEAVADTVLSGATHTAKLFYYEINRARNDYLADHAA